MVDWLNQGERPYAWLSLDDSDNDLPLFVSYFVEAVSSVYPMTCEPTNKLLQTTDRPQTEQVSATLLNDIFELPEPIILVLDDYHLIHDVGIHQLLNLLLQSLPETLQLVICSRTDPFLPLPRLRVKGQSVEIRTNDLRFTHLEAREFMRLSGYEDLDYAIIMKLNERVEGWPAGLRLAVLSVMDTDDQSVWLSNSQMQSDQFFTEYLFSEVLQQQSEPVQDFLLRTAIMDRFCVDLYLALQDSGDPVASRLPSQPILAEISEANLFIIPLDETDGWYRYHHLFQDMLRQKLLAQVGQQGVTDIHRQAANWFAENGHLEEALKHALVAADMKTAVSIVEENSRNFLNGLERRTLERWMDSLPEDVVWLRPKLLIAKAWLLYRHWRIQAMEPILNRVDVLLATNDNELTQPEVDFIQGQMLTLRSAVDFHVHFEYERAIATADEAVVCLPLSEGGALSTAYLTRSLAMIGKAQKDNAVHDLVQIVDNPAPTGPAKLQALMGLCMVSYVSGDLIQLEQMSAKLKVMDAKSSRATGPSYYFNGLLNFELNNLEIAAETYTVMYQARASWNYLAGFHSGLVLMRIRQIHGAFDDVQQYIDDANAELLSLNHTEFWETLTAFQAYHWQIIGNTTDAYRWAQHYEPNFEKDRILAFDPPGHWWARMMLDMGHRDEKTAVTSYLQQNLAQLQPTQFNRRKIQLLAQLASAQQSLGEIEAAQESLKQAVLLAQSGGHVRSFLDVGQSIVPLMQQFDPGEFIPGYLQQLLKAFGAQPITPSLEEATRLTTRETEILELMAVGKSNQEIADDLVISIHTTKRHASNIYNKLTVNGRRQAIHKAKQLGILN